MVAVFVVGLSAPPARAATEIQRVTFKGIQVTASFATFTNITCADNSDGFIIANGFLNGAEQIFRTAGSPTFMSNGVTMDLSYFNSCTGTSVSASGGFPNALTPANKKLDSASMVGSGTVQDFSTGQTVPVSFNVSFVGEGQTFQSKGTSKSTIVGSTGGPISVFTSRSAGAFRFATATGTMSIEGFAVNVDFTSAAFNQNDNSSKTFTKM